MFFQLEDTFYNYVQINVQVKAGKVYATATEDMDALTFGSNVLLRHLTFSEARKMPIQEIHLDKVLEGLKLNQQEVSEYLYLIFTLTRNSSKMEVKNYIILSNRKCLIHICRL